MALTLHFHPLSSYCWKALTAFYENATPFSPHMLHAGEPDVAAAYKRLWPIGKMPLLQDDARGETVPESTIIIEYLDRHYPGPTRFIPEDPELALQVRLSDRLFDLYVHDPMQRIVGNTLRPADKKDEYGAEQAREMLRTAYRMLDGRMRARTWAAGDSFTLADCAAAPALYYGEKLVPFGPGNGALAAYLDRLKARPSFARVLAEAAPYFEMFPGG